jgi:hypothetical protein
LKLLLLPGMDGTGLLFEPLLEALPNWIEPSIVVYPPQEPLGYAELLAHVQTACPTAEEFAVLAESFSGPLAVMLAASEPRGLHGVVLAASFIRCPLSAPWSWLLSRARPICFRLAPKWPARRLLFGRHGNDCLDRLLATALAMVSPETMAARARTIAGVDVTAELRSCQLPLVYLIAKEDRVVRPNCLAMIQSEKPDIEVVELAGPHLLLQACPQEAAHAVASFVERSMIGPGSCAGSPIDSER